MRALAPSYAEMIALRSHAIFSRQSNPLDFDRLDAELQLAPEPIPELFRRVAVNDGSPDKSQTDRRLEFLLATEAWTEAALLLVEITSRSVRFATCDMMETSGVVYSLL